MTLEPMSATDGYKTYLTAEKMGSEVKGVILNMIKKTKGELSEKDITSLLNVPVLARIKEDDELKKSVLQGKPLIKTNEANASIQEILKLASKETGVTYTPKKGKNSFLKNILKIFKKN